MKLFFLVFVSMTIIFAQCEKEHSFYVACWNVENLFDNVDNPDKEDDDFTEAGIKEWNDERIKEKFDNIAHVMQLMNEGDGPDIIGFIEVEHKHLLDSLCCKYFSQRNYKVIGYESPDMRGIDNYLVYDDDKFHLVDSKAIEVRFYGEEYKTRDILHVTLGHNDEKVDFFVNHWPSRRGGEESSQPRRINAASTLLRYLDSLNTVRSPSNYIIMGDFNDEPHNYSLSNVLNASKDTINSFLINLAWDSYEQGDGTHLYQNNFNMLDQIIISKSLIDGKGIDYIDNSFEIFRDDSFIYKDGKRKGSIVSSFEGGKYIGGYADHLPVVAKFLLIKK